MQPDSSNYFTELKTPSIHFVIVKNIWNCPALFSLSIDFKKNFFFRKKFDILGREAILVGLRNFDPSRMVEGSRKCQSVALLKTGSSNSFIELKTPSIHFVIVKKIWNCPALFSLSIDFKKNVEIFLSDRILPRSGIEPENATRDVHFTKKSEKNKFFFHIVSGWSMMLQLPPKVFLKCQNTLGML